MVLIPSCCHSTIGDCVEWLTRTSSCCCYSESPMDRMSFCNGEQVHFFCSECARSYVENEIGMGKCRPVCLDTSGCGATINRAQLLRFLDEKTFSRLEKLQQDDDIREAGLTGLAECPFCDFKMVCPPVTADRVFWCRSPDCERASCRLCNKESHLPLSCEDFEKDRRTNVRHKVEEAMTEALVRSCKCVVL